MFQDSKKQLKKLIIFKQNPQLALFDQLEELNINIKALIEAFSEHSRMMSNGMDNMCDKMDIMNKKEPLEMPEIDLTKTNDLLKELLKQEQKPEDDITITFDLV